MNISLQYDTVKKVVNEHLEKTDFSVEYCIDTYEEYFIPYLVITCLTSGKTNTIKFKTVRKTVVVHKSINTSYNFLINFMLTVNHSENRPITVYP